LSATERPEYYFLLKVGAVLTTPIVDYAITRCSVLEYAEIQGCGDGNAAVEWPFHHPPIVTSRIGGITWADRMASR